VFKNVQEEFKSSREFTRLESSSENSKGDYEFHRERENLRERERELLRDKRNTKLSRILPHPHSHTSILAVMIALASRAFAVTPCHCVFVVVVLHVGTQVC
jgi:hypothetical protein